MSSRRYDKSGRAPASRLDSSAARSAMSAATRSGSKRALSMTILARYFARKPKDESWQRELAWPYAKLSDVNQRKGDADGNADSRKTSYSAALDYLANSLCLRRQVAVGNPAKIEYARDVSYTLDRVGLLRDRLSEAAGAELAYF